MRLRNQISKYPSVSRDLAFVVKKTTDYQSFYDTVFKHPKHKYLNKIQLFDVYEGDRVPKDSKSLAAHYIFSSEEKTLTDKEINKEITCLAKWLEDQIGAQQR